mgnify:CR=1 FL=1
MTTQNLTVDLIDTLGKIVASKEIAQGSTLCVFETDTVYNGIYFIRIIDHNEAKTFKVIIDKWYEWISGKKFVLWKKPDLMIGLFVFCYIRWGKCLYL